MASTQSAQSDTATAILDSAEQLVQRRGFNGFSYADVADELGLTKASLHYHFAGKAELGQSLLQRYTTRFTGALAAIDAEDLPAPGKLRAYCGLYRTVLAEKRMCLCGMLAAEYETLPVSMRAAVVDFLDRNRKWLASLLDTGRSAGELRFNGSAEEGAESILAGLEGAMLVSRPYGSTDILDSVTERVVADFAGP